MSPEVIRWLDMAKQDEAVAEHLLESFRPVPVEIICYHCQQAAEKAIKALLIAQGVDSLPRSHDLSFLLNSLAKPEVIPERVYEDADRLTPLRCSGSVSQRSGTGGTARSSGNGSGSGGAELGQIHYDRIAKTLRCRSSDERYPDSGFFLFSWL